MKSLIVIITLAALIGCSADSSDNGCGAINSYTTEQTDATGIILEPSNEMYVDFETVSKLYQETQACMGMTAPAPRVAWIEFNQRTGSIGGWGLYHPSAEIVWINLSIDEVIPRNCHSDRETLKHEYVHHILHLNGMGDQSAGHASPMFEKCGIGVYVKDGVPAPK
jgi:hypothetical protein